MDPLLLGPDDFSESTDASLVPSIWTSEGMEMRGVDIAEDIDGDSVRDLVSSTHYYLGDFPTGRVLTFLGPIDAQTMGDSTFSDADIILETDQEERSFGITVAVLGDYDDDGHRTVMVGHPASGRTDTDSVRFFEPSTAPPGSRLDESSVTRPSWFAGSAVGDIDLDGQDEIAIPVSAQSDGAEADRVYLYEAPTAGVASLDDYEAELRSDEDIDKYAGFGSALIAGHDLDGDSSPDLLVGGILLGRRPGPVLRALWTGDDLPRRGGVAQAATHPPAVGAADRRDRSRWRARWDKKLACACLPGGHLILAQGRAR